MKRGVAIAIGASALFHIGALVVLDGVEPPPRRRNVAVRLRFEPLPPSLPPSVPIDVSMVMIPPPAAASVPPPAPVAPAPVVATPTSRPAAAPPLVAMAATSTTAATDVSGVGSTVDPAAPPGGGEPGPGVPGMMSMRRGAGAPDLDPRKQTFTVVDDPDAPPPWTPPPASGELRPSGSGTHTTPRPGFTGHVAADGDVSFTDKKAMSAHIALPNPKKVGKRIARGIADWYRDPHRQVRRQQVDKSTCMRGGGDGTNNCLAVGDYGGEGEIPLDDLAKYAAPLEHDGDSGDDTVTIPVLAGSTEITDWVMRKAGMDPYQSDKLRWMDATRDERVEISRVHRERQLARATEIMRRHLDRLWARTDLDLATKREALFELWDDGAEDGDAHVVEAADRTRALVLGFIVAHLPPGSPAAYTTAELATLNRRRTSRATFAPY